MQDTHIPPAVQVGKPIVAPLEGTRWVPIAQERLDVRIRVIMALGRVRTPDGDRWIEPMEARVLQVLTVYDGGNGRGCILGARGIQIEASISRRQYLFAAARSLVEIGCVQQERVPGKRYWTRRVLAPDWLLHAIKNPRQQAPAPAPEPVPEPVPEPAQEPEAAPAPAPAPAPAHTDKQKEALLATLRAENADSDHVAKYCEWLRSNHSHWTMAALRSSYGSYCAKHPPPQPEEKREWQPYKAPNPRPLDDDQPDTLATPRDDCISRLCDAGYDADDIESLPLSRLMDMVAEIDRRE